MFSRGGAFEVNALESLARGIPVVTSNVGSWVDYVPDFLRVKVGDKVKVFDDNIIHVGLGNKIDVDDAVNKIHDILNNYDEYKAKTEQFKLDALANEYRWDIIAKNLAGIIKTYIPI
jgi:glycosyltransferase involved in cell wall biosynthesis